MSEEKSSKSDTITISKGKLMPFVVFITIALAFAVGVLWQKVQTLESGNAPVAVGSNNQAGTANIKGDPDVAPPAPKAGDVDPVSDEDHVRGDRGARIALIEYSDLECPFCKSFHATAQQAVDDYDGKVMWVYRHFPLDRLHSKARKEAEATECAAKLAGNDGFWKLTDKIYETTPSNNGLDLSTLSSLASSVGINKVAFQKCLDSGEMAQHVSDDLASGSKAGVSSTPGNILLDTKTGETKLIRGAVPYPQIKQAIDAMLAK